MIFELHIGWHWEEALLHNVMMDFKHVLWLQRSLLQYTSSKVNELVQSVTCDGKKTEHQRKWDKTTNSRCCVQWLNGKPWSRHITSINTIVFLLVITYSVIDCKQWHAFTKERLLGSSEDDLKCLELNLEKYIRQSYLKRSLYLLTTSRTSVRNTRQKWLKNRWDHNEW